MNRWSDNLDYTSHLSLTESTIMMGEPASAETRTLGSEMEAVQKSRGGRRRETTRRSCPWCPSLCACPSSTPERPIIIPRPPTLPPSLSPLPSSPAWAFICPQLPASTTMPQFRAVVCPSVVRVRRFYCNENERGVCGPDDVRPDPIPFFILSPPGKRVLIWCPRPRPCPSAGPVGPAKKFQKTNGIHHLNKWFFCLKLNRRNDRPRPNPTGENERGTQRSGGQTICIL